MSLIQEALKRQSQEEQKPIPPKDAPKAGLPKIAELNTPPAPESSSSSDKLMLILASVIVLILIVIGLTIYFVLQAKKPIDVPTVIVPVAEEIPAPPAVEPPAEVVEKTPEPAKEPISRWPELTFTGSAASGNQRLAIINGRMLSAGDLIKGVRVLKIEKDSVLLDYQGEQRTINVNDR